MSYRTAVFKARKIINNGGDSEDLRLAVGEAIRTAPTDKDRDLWRTVADKLSQGLSVKTKELEQ